MTLSMTRSEHARSPLPAMRADGAVGAPPLALVLRHPGSETDSRYSGAPACTRILIADGHEIVRAGLRSILEDQDG